MITRFRPPLGLFLPLSVCLTLVSNFLACGSGGGANATAPAPAVQPGQTPVPPAPVPGVAPFDPALVPRWPGLPNLGSTCFINTAVKLLACLPEIDGRLPDQAGDDPATASVRRDLRSALNWIRSGGVREGHGADPGLKLMRSLKAAMEGHPALKGHVTLKGGGHAGDLIDGLVKTLGVPGPLRMAWMEKTPGGSPAVPATWAEVPDLVLNATLNPEIANYDFSGVRDVEGMIRHVAAHGTLDPRPTMRYPVAAPASVFLKVEEVEPPLALKFRDTIQVPLFQVDPAAHTVAPLGDARLEARAMAFFGKGHYWAAIRGRDGWYANNDAQPVRPMSQEELDGVLDAEGVTERRAAVILFRRTQ